VEFIADAEEKTEEEDDEDREGAVRFTGIWVQGKEKGGCEGAIGHEVQQLVQTEKTWQSQNIAGLVGKKKNHPHDDNHGDESQHELHSRTLPAGTSVSC